MGISNQLRDIDNGFEIVASFPELQGHADHHRRVRPRGLRRLPASRPIPQNGYRNGTLYASYTAAQLARTYELAELHGVNCEGAVTWAFEFEDQPYFAGFRVLATNGIAQPVLNVFRMFGLMGGDRVAVESSGALPLEAVRDAGVRDSADVTALASRSERTISVLVWNYHDDDLPAPPADVELSLAGVPAGERSSVDALPHRRDHSNAYEAWKRMGSPQPPTQAQYQALERAGQLQALDPSRRVKVEDGRLPLPFALPRQAVSLVRVTW